jgi:hypothetical protein
MNFFLLFLKTLIRLKMANINELEDMRDSDPTDFRFDLIVDNVQETDLAMQEHELKMMLDHEYAEKINNAMSRIVITDFKQLESNTTILEKTCPYCKKEFSNKYTMKTHLKICSAIGREIVCGALGCIFKTNDIRLFNQHKIIHREARFICKICGERFKEDVLLYYHKLTHEPIIYKCEFCHKEFKFKSSFVRHKKNKHPKLL